MLLVGLTGGIGAGKSTVARLLAARGAAVIEADDLARDAVARGTDAFDRDRRGVRSRRSSLPTATSTGGGWARSCSPIRNGGERSESIVHPEVARLFVEAVDPFRETDQVVVYSVPLLVERGWSPRSTWSS